VLRSRAGVWAASCGCGPISRRDGGRGSHEGGGGALRVTRLPPVPEMHSSRHTENGHH
jgi:hypothetical protein